MESDASGRRRERVRRHFGLFSHSGDDTSPPSSQEHDDVCQQQYNTRITETPQRFTGVEPQHRWETRFAPRRLSTSSVSGSSLGACALPDSAAGGGKIGEEKSRTKGDCYSLEKSPPLSFIADRLSDKVPPQVPRYRNFSECQGGYTESSSAGEITRDRWNRDQAWQISSEMGKISDTFELHNISQPNRNIMVSTSAHYPIRGLPPCSMSNAENRPKQCGNTPKLRHESRSTSNYDSTTRRRRRSLSECSPRAYQDPIFIPNENSYKMDPRVPRMLARALSDISLEESSGKTI